MSSIEMSARDWASALENRESARAGVSIPVARRVVARRIGVSPGSLENLRRGRSKGVRAFVYEKIRAAFITECEQEMKRLSHELEMASKSGLNASDNQASEITAHLAALRELMN